MNVPTLSMVFAAFLLSLVPSNSLSAADPSVANHVFLQEHCVHCHDDSTQWNTKTR